MVDASLPHGMSKHAFVVGHMKCSSTSVRALASHVDLSQCKRDGLKISEIGLVKKVGRRQGHRHHETKPYRPQEEDESPTILFSGGRRRNNFYLLLLLLPLRGAKAVLLKTPEASEYNCIGCTGSIYKRRTYKRAIGVYMHCINGAVVEWYHGTRLVVHINACDTRTRRRQRVRLYFVPLDVIWCRKGESLSRLPFSIPHIDYYMESAFHSLLLLSHTFLLQLQHQQSQTERLYWSHFSIFIPTHAF